MTGIALPELPEGWFWRVRAGGYNFFSGENIDAVQLRRRVGRFSVWVSSSHFYQRVPEHAPYAAEMVLEKYLVRLILKIKDPKPTNTEIYGDY